MLEIEFSIFGEQASKGGLFGEGAPDVVVGLEFVNLRFGENSYEKM